ncbi:hypothetical protein KVR01_004884 [Diaporthe batatas]|uniref:uncharacterized protein n=1 Tax=Diaporthe batatas TaxID=748121 RepID=UPI001D057A67|nr:uncharacterized protein KVR01_004884 [Diaporthe batatas]KAG8164609.1 hypothetical protein KVR01_004884 [Diaporthe batatas]
MEPHSQLPDGVSRQLGVVMLQDNEFFLSCDPHLNKYEAKGEVTEPQIPAGVNAHGPTRSYEVTDQVENIPKGIWGSTVVSTYEFTNIENGVFSRVKSPLGVRIDTLWEIKEAEGGKLDLVQAAEISCTKPLMSLVKGRCEAGWGKIHAKMLERLQNDAKAAA